MKKSNLNNMQTSSKKTNKKGFTLAIVVVSMAVIFLIMSLALILSSINYSTVQKTLKISSERAEIETLGANFIKLGKADFEKYCFSHNYYSDGAFIKNDTYKLEISETQLYIYKETKKIFTIIVDTNGNCIKWVYFN